MPLTKEQLDRWVKALRDNPGEQRKGYLSVNGGFCCLGKLAQLEGVPMQPGDTEAPLELRSSQTLFFPIKDNLPAANCRYVAGDLRKKLAREGHNNRDAGAGMFKNLGMPDLEEHESLADANDAGVTWAAIADHLEKHYPYEGKPK